MENTHQLPDAPRSGHTYYGLGYTFINWIKWLLRGRPFIYCEGYHCGLCGSWNDEPYSIRDYLYSGWGVCNKCSPLWGTKGADNQRKQGSSSVGRTTDFDSVGRRFESFLPFKIWGVQLSRESVSLARKMSQVQPLSPPPKKINQGSRYLNIEQ